MTRRSPLPPFFRAEGSGIPELTEEAVAAYEELRSRLEQEGWSLAGEGDEWFAQTFRMASPAGAEPAQE
jgi:hypothetical protein